ncbi:ClpP/crotonase [Gonapodya prolifera JEL478]|uniref:Enoyl-CoA hydratase domain-containing protein 3, mitochondrial n=1 Tax=Gonapodya prolifera (strain JEL478) TaxID=1344416 RepID=A0A139AYH3_GONPJ|nr:ClpP/crotonase [Gonapodya prolifera JEL478]|eukprot:KXS21757.1 ClpP/crotonase [Gonapodya prolifera JEL478]
MGDCGGDKAEQLPGGLFFNMMMSSPARPIRPLLRTIRPSRTLRPRSFSIAAAPARSHAEGPGPSPKDGVWHVRISNVRKRGALSLAVLESLENQLLEINPGWSYNPDWIDLNDVEGSLSADRGVNKKVKAVILSSEGDVFSSGHDLKEMATHDRSLIEAVFAKCTDVMLLLRRLPQPVIAQVQGLTTAAGTQLVAQCDQAVASDRATFATPGISIGLFCTTPSVPLARPLALPSKQSLRMLYTGDQLSAADALTHGLVSHVVPHDEVRDYTQELAASIARRSFRTLVLGKWAFHRHSEMPTIEESYRFGEKVMVANMMLGDAKMGVDAFLAKKPQPDWE